ncbi:MAG: AarF/ABC1/UbiB kinase family protein [Acidobacteria bacterium]|nr:AarF/ABC1/UbiB kinase family protein [Acidobacteriota bacterium]
MSTRTLESGGSESPATRPRSRRGGQGDLLFLPPRPRRPTSGPGIAASGAISAADLPPDTELVSAGFFGVVRRVCEMLAAILYFYVAGLLDRLLLDWREVLRRGSFKGRGLRLTARRAVRLRKVLQWLGGTFIKVGQQLAIRSDVLPPLYCRELENLLDNADPIPDDYVREVLERVLERIGKRFDEVFAAFNFSPIGRASIACVYKARLLSGKVVAVKVRRPDIVKIFKTDLAALDLVAEMLEFITVLRPRVTDTFRSELRLMLLEELDFRIETRYQELFRRYYKRRKKLRTTAPKLHPKLCGREVIVSEFVTGIWLKDMIAGVESPDREGYREWLGSLDVCPKRIAKQLIRGSHYGFFECPFFHGDPHPGNVLVQPHNRIVMVDFGACGVFSERERLQLAQMHYYQAREDVGGMVQCVIGLMEPLPPIDIDPFRRRLEDAWWKGFYGIKSKHAEWWERTSFRLWSALLREVRRAQIPLPLSVLRMIRATLLYDTVGARLYDGINVFKEYRWYYERYARRVRADIQKSIVRQIFRGLDPQNYVRIRRLWDVGNLLLQQTQLFMRKPLPDFSALVSKGWDILKLILKWSLLEIAVTLAAAGVLAFRFLGRIQRLLPPRGQVTVWDYPRALLKQVGADVLNPAVRGPGIVLAVWGVLILFISFKYIRSMWFRLSDKDILLNGRDSGRGR